MTPNAAQLLKLAANPSDICVWRALSNARSALPRALNDQILQRATDRLHWCGQFGDRLFALDACDFEFLLAAGATAEQKKRAPRVRELWDRSRD